MSEQQIRERVRQLKQFYSHIANYVVVNLALIVIWAVTGGGYFWPIWVILGWGIGLIIEAFNMGLVPQLKHFFPFMQEEWEEQQVSKLLKATQSAPKPEAPVKPIKEIQNL